MSVADDLDNAADYIEQNGWVQGGLCNIDTGAVCAHGSIMEVTQGLAALHTSERLIRSTEVDLRCESVARAFANHIDSHIATWNDAKNRTQSQVVQALRDAATKNRTDSMTVEGGK